MKAVYRTLTFRNESTLKGYACVFQSHPEADEPNRLTVAWLSKLAYPTTEVVFQWAESYSLIWSEAGRLETGVTCVASQVWDADLCNTNMATLTYHQGAFTFRDQTAGPREGSLYIPMDRTVPLEKALVGFGMAGKAVCATPAVPNAEAIFTPKPRYFLAFGNYKEGQVLDLEVFTKAVEIKFQHGSTQTATLTRENIWKVEGAR